MKICTKCKVKKSLDEFFAKDKLKGKLHAQCKECYKSHRRSYYQEHYQKYKEDYLSRAKLRRERLRKEYQFNIIEYLSNKACVICGENDIRVLEFDHIIPKAKSFSISQGVKLGYAWKDIASEIAKCRILCANCHKKETAKQFNWYKS